MINGRSDINRKGKSKVQNKVTVRQKRYSGAQARQEAVSCWWNSEGQSSLDVSKAVYSGRSRSFYGFCFRLSVEE
jgi:hypothetical protein